MCEFFVRAININGAVGCVKNVLRVSEREKSNLKEREIARERSDIGMNKFHVAVLLKLRSSFLNTNYTSLGTI